MIIRATAKLLKTSRISPVKNSNDPRAELPGEWYSGLVSMGRPGKLAIHFLHYPTMISIIVPGRSLNKALKILPQRCESLLKRLDFSSLSPQFKLNSETQVFTTNSRSMLSHMTQMKFNLEAHLSEAKFDEEIDWEILEDYFTDYLFTRHNDYTTAREVLTNIASPDTNYLKHSS